MKSGVRKFGVAVTILLAAAISRNESAEMSPQQKDGHHETLEGTWECIISIIDGKVDTESIGLTEQNFGKRYIGDGAVMRWSNRTSSDEYFVEYSLNSAQSPREIDLVLLERSKNSRGEQSESRKPFAKGIFLIKNDVLVLCLSNPLGPHPSQRPRSFSAEPPNWILVYKKLARAKGGAAEEKS